jgi:class 3 adenylate cyclase
MKPALALLKDRPHLALVPLLLFCALAALAVSVTLFASSLVAASSRSQLQLAATQAASALSRAFSGALAPLATVRSALEDGAGAAASHAAAMAYWASARARLLATSPALACLQLAPYGYVAAIHPLVVPGLNLTGVLLAGGLDLFNAANGLINHRPAATATLVSGAPYTQGPQQVFACVGATCSSTASPALALITRAPVFVPAAAGAPEAWSGGATWPPVPGGPTVGPFAAVSNCSGLRLPSACEADGVLPGRKFWGFVTAIVRWDTLLEQSGLAALEASSGASRWAVARSPPSGGPGWLPAASSSGALPTEPYDGGVVGMSGGATGSVAWEVTLEPPGGTFTPGWTAPAVGAGVAGCALLAGALFLHLLARARIEEVLHSALPARAVKALAGRAGACSSSSSSSAGGKGGAAAGAAPGAAAAAAPAVRHALFSERFDSVAFIFVDIVGFTELCSRIDPSEAMGLLVSVFDSFDRVTLRHGAVKVETAGDAYMVVVGTEGALHGQAREQARAAAALALDLIDAASEHALPDGTPLRVRVGAHCGPIVAGVVGRLMPHWSPFGDTVNLAARMESTGAPMRLHASAAFAGHLAGDARFEVAERLGVAVKGRGLQTTAWVARAGGEAAAPGSPGVVSPGGTTLYTRSVGSGSASGSGPGTEGSQGADP